MNNIIINHLSKIYHNNFYALKNINLMINPQQITVIIGKSGSGKTTLLRLLNGLEFPNEGEIILPPNLRQAMVFQEDRLLPWLTVRENILFWEQRDPSDLLNELELMEFQNYYPHEISGGMAQKTALARALICDTQLILMDEPFSSLDYFTKKHLHEKLLLLSKKFHLGIVFITHDVDEALILGDELLILEEGQLKQHISNPLPKYYREFSEGFVDLKKQILSIITIEK